MSKTKIQWSQETLNPTTGCKEISAGCANCYAKRFAERFRGVEGHPYENGFDFQLHENRLAYPYKWKSPRLVFINSMSDLFYEETPDEFITKVFDMITDTPQHTYQILTKRPERMLSWINNVYKKPLPSNLWLGVTVENASVNSRIELLKQTTAKVKFISIEPLISDAELTEEMLCGIDWVIVGGETGPGARPMEKGWVDSIYALCKKLNIPFFFKHWGAYDADGRKLKPGNKERLYNGETIEEYPSMQNENI
jgi:protein gp37